MTWRAVQHNRKDIPYKALRERIDTAYEALHDGLSDAYYNHWSQGQSYPWFLWDVRPSAAATETQYRLLQGFLSDLYTVIFHRCNMALPQPWPREEYDAIYDRSGVVTGYRSDAALAKLQATAQQYLTTEERQAIHNWLDTKLTAAGFPGVVP